MKKYLNWIVFSAFIICAVVICAMLYLQVQLSQKETQSEKFQQRTNAFLFTMRERFSKNQVLINGTQGFFSASQYVTVKEWNDFFYGQKIGKTLPGIEWIGYVVELSSLSFPKYMEKYRSENSTAFSIWPETAVFPQYPIVQVFPNSSKNIIGYNCGSNETLLATMKSSALSKSSIATAPLDFGQASNGIAERLVVQSVDKNQGGMTPGWIIAQIDFSLLIDSVAKGAGLSDMNIFVYAGDSVELSNLIYKKGEKIENLQIYRSTNKINFAGKNWTFIFEVPVTKEDQTKAISFLVLSGILVVLYFAAFLYFIFYKKNAVSSTVETQLVKNMEYAVIATDVEGTITYLNPAAEEMLGYASSELVGQKTPEVFHDKKEMQERAEELTTTLDRTITPGFEVFVTFAREKIPENRNWTYVAKDGTRIPVRLSVQAITDSSDTVVGYLGVAIDASKSL